MRKEVKILKNKSLNSLILSVEIFNRPWEIGRIDAFLILIDHSFEMLLKASILHRGGKIRKRGEELTIGFDACLRKSHTESQVKFLSENQVLQLQAINSLRDAAQHHLLDISEEHLYLHAQAGLTLFKDIFKKVFDENLISVLPKRILPISTTPPTDVETLFEKEVGEVRKLLRPKQRKTVEANAKLRALTILDGAIAGEKSQPTDRQLTKLAAKVKEGNTWEEIFPNVASLNFTQKGFGPSIDLRITKKDGIPVHLVPEGEAKHVVAIKRVDELGFYNMGVKQLAENVGLSTNKTVAVIKHLQLKNDAECFKMVKIGGSTFQRYSEKAIAKIKNCLKNVKIEYIWEDYMRSQRSNRRKNR